MNGITARWLFCLGVLLPAAVAAQSPPATARVDPVFATVGERKILLSEYRQALSAAMRKKYYHAKPPEAEVARFQREVGDDVVNHILLLAEARKRGIQPDRKRIEATLADYESRYQGSKSWEENKEKMKAAVAQQMQTESLLEQLERQVRQVREPSEKEAQGFFERNKSLFIEPEQVKLGVILLKVDPSSPKTAWVAADEEAGRIHARLSKGTAFDELARLHSADASAARGGDMGYIHRGMLPEAVHATVDALKPGAFSSPVRVLEGVAILKLEDRKLARQRTFDEVRERAGDLWQRAEGEAAWKRLIAELRRQTPVKIDESHYLPLQPSQNAARPG